MLSGFWDAGSCWNPCRSCLLGLQLLLFVLIISRCLCGSLIGGLFRVQNSEHAQVRNDAIITTPLRDSLYTSRISLLDTFA
jgi:hypothetical protein